MGAGAPSSPDPVGAAEGKLLAGTLLGTDAPAPLPAGWPCIFALIDCCCPCTSCISFSRRPIRALISSSESFSACTCPET